MRVSLVPTPPPPPHAIRGYTSLIEPPRGPKQNAGQALRLCYTAAWPERWWGGYIRPITGGRRLTTPTRRPQAARSSAATTAAGTLRTRLPSEPAIRCRTHGAPAPLRNADRTRPAQIAASTTCRLDAHPVYTCCLEQVIASGFVFKGSRQHLSPPSPAPTHPPTHPPRPHWKRLGVCWPWTLSAASQTWTDNMPQGVWGVSGRCRGTGKCGGGSGKGWASMVRLQCPH